MYSTSNGQQEMEFPLRNGSHLAAVDDLRAAAAGEQGARQDHEATGGGGQPSTAGDGLSNVLQ